ncbi:alpha-ketoacid dehydrogenase subunit alpha/beta [Tessaracoccus flavus]|uniref:dihydrolipoyllysine-residue succinyltransferase n=1 Tax=Tessaracoccus flavus TaxID=1610493 RepID=A0A1Q2CGT5_9ACTN|nr:alpha-ketoacid dehydrogenase subunit alpha/beta [Tessaracoccus flavus]AQP45332.1 dehydrogenase [Tessaracoccus flavus]SDY48517.1 2-oxoisovalerate dehydrogenase E1 component [Tessaracoccus flavus]
MPRNLVVDPSNVRSTSAITAPSIPVNQYQPDFEAELATHGKEGLIDILHDMIAVRQFETMLNSIKTTGAWNGVEYNHRGPAHLSIGQESAVVGQASQLDPTDFVFGSHRSHGEILAKCFSAARKLDPAELERIMKEFLDGETLGLAERVSNDDLADLAENFIVYGTVAETFARSAGFNRGLGGSMHAFFAPFGSMPNNAIVGGSADIATGSAMFKRINEQPGIVIANIGDASMGCGPVWEAMMIAAMDQYRTLWDKGGNPPIWFNFFNNFYGMGGQTSGETMGYDILARVGAGVNPEAMHSERVDGLNPLAVADAVARKRKILESGRGPVLTDTITYRFSGHSPSDASSYRSKEEVELWEQHDGLKNYAAYLIDNGVLTSDDVDAMQAKFDERLTKVIALATQGEDVSPRVHMDFIETVMYSGGNKPSLDETREPELLQPLEENARVKSLAGKARYYKDKDGKPVSKAKTFSYRDALFEAVAHGFATDPTMAAWGEENRDWGGAFAVYRGLTELLPYHRLFNSPISEAAIIGAGVGYALSGGRALVELMYCDFLGRAGDEIFNQAPKWQAMSGGLLQMPLVMRVSVGAKYGAQHSQDWSALTAHMPGLKVYYPATPYDAKGMMNLALRGTDPVMFFESQKLYDIGEQFVTDGVPADYYEVPEGEPVVRREGKDLTLAVIGPTLYPVLETAEVLEKKYSLSAEVIDLRFLVPLNLDPIVESVKKTGRLVLATDAVNRGSFLHNVASSVQELAFDHLDAPVVVVGSRNAITPAAELEDEYFPQVEWLLDTIHEKILPLRDHTPTTTQTNGELARRWRHGL